MDYAKFNTTSEILEAFQALHGNKGMEMELFEGLATRSDPPTTAFAEILQRIKLESALVLAIKAFGQITDADLQVQLKQSDDLLVMLSRQASTGSSDLIRWAAATTIDRIGFSFLATSQHLSERPADIAANIVESKRKILISYDDNTHREQKITDLADYRAFIDFWVYGATYDLRSITVNCCGKNSSLVVSEVVKAQSIHGIKETNKLLQKNEQRDYPDELTRKAYKNELFEKFTRPLSIELLAVKNPYGFKDLVINQGHDLQHHQLKIRVKAASILAKLDRNDVLNELNDRGDLLLLMAEMILVCDRDLQWKYPYEEMVRDDLQELATNLTRVINQLWQNPVKKYYHDYLDKISQDIKLLEPGQSIQERLVVLAKKRQQEESERQVAARAEAEGRRAREEQQQTAKKAEDKRQRQHRKADEERHRQQEVQRQEAQRAEDEKLRIARKSEVERLSKLQSQKDFWNGLSNVFSSSISWIISSIPVIAISSVPIIFIFTGKQGIITAIGHTIGLFIAGAILGPLGFWGILLLLAVGGIFTPIKDMAFYNAMSGLMIAFLGSCCAIECYWPGIISNPLCRLMKILKIK